MLKVRRLIAAAIAVQLVALAAPGGGAARADAARDREGARVAQGYRIAPVPLNLTGLDRRAVGLGSYIVNAQGGCNDCHTNPSYAPGGDPFQGQPKRVNRAGYLAGGNQFGPSLVSPNLTPDENRRPGGMTLAQFLAAIRQGHDPDDPGRLLQVMPWPVYQDMTTFDLWTIYQYLRAIPSIRRAS
jgi:hypothetical protein